MFSTDQLIKQLSSDRAKGFIKRLAVAVYDQNFDINQLIDLTFHPDKQIGFRAAWLLDTIVNTSPELYVDKLEYFVKRMADVENESCKRHYARIMLNLTARNVPAPIRQKLGEIDMEGVVEICFDWLIDPKVKVAVKVSAADVLYNLQHRYDWIKDELVNQIQFMMRDGSAAIQSRGKILLASISSKKLKVKIQKTGSVANHSF